jgi:hypothetical protein
MKGTFALPITPNNLRLPWLMRALRYTPEEAFKNLEQLDSLDSIIAGGLIDQPLKLIDEMFDENIKHGTTLMVSWHWAENCDGEFYIEQLDSS